MTHPRRLLAQMQAVGQEPESALNPREDMTSLCECPVCGATSLTAQPYEVWPVPEYAEYVEPDAETYLCYRDGRLRSEEVTELRWGGQGAPPATDASGAVDYGHIDSMRFQEGVFDLEGDLGLDDRSRRGCADRAGWRWVSLW